MRFSTKIRDCRLIVRGKASWGEEIDQIAVDAFARLALSGFLKPKMVRKNLIEYSGPIGVSLFERFKSPVNKHDFLLIIEQIVAAVQKIQSNHLVMNRVILNLQNVYINGVTKEVQFLYVPSSKIIGGADIDAFIESIIYSIRPASPEDANTVSCFTYFFKNQKAFNPELVEQFVEKEAPDIVSMIKKQNAKQSGFIANKQQQYYEHYPNSSKNGQYSNCLATDGNFAANQFDNRYARQESDRHSKYDDDSTGLLLEDDATGVLYGEENEGLPEYEENETGLLFDDDPGTELLAEPENVRYPTLFRLTTGETISVNKPIFRLGKERSYVDYFVTNNNAVSRSHADIITRGDQYFVVDLNSKNHTYINNRVLAVQCETEIRDGDHLKLGNEEFIFQL